MAKYQEPYRPAYKDHKIVRPAAWESHTQLDLTPQSVREMESLKTEGSSAHTSGEYDQGQLEEFEELRKQKIQQLYKTGSNERRPAADPKVSEDFYNNTLDVDGTIYQQDQETGQFAILSEPAKDMATAEEKDLESRAKRQEIKAKFMQQQASITTADGAPRRKMEEIEADAERLFGEETSRPQITPEEFDGIWLTLRPGEPLRGPDGKMYVKKGV